LATSEEINLSLIKYRKLGKYCTTVYRHSCDDRTIFVDRDAKLFGACGVLAYDVVHPETVTITWENKGHCESYPMIEFSPVAYKDDKVPYEETEAQRIKRFKALMYEYEALTQSTLTSIDKDNAIINKNIASIDYQLNDLNKSTSYLISFLLLFTLAALLVQAIF
jgi:hypothetical protein